MRPFKVFIFIFFYLIIYLFFSWSTFSLKNIDETILPISFSEVKAESKKIQNVNCTGIFDDDKTEIEKAYSILNSNQPFKLVPDSTFIFGKEKCPIFLNTWHENFDYISKEEIGFPLAFTILTYQHAEQFQRFLKSIYRPHNIYCIHVDKKSKPEFKSAIESIVDCFENVFIASKLEYVVYAGFSRLKADFNCIQDLLNLSNEWKYLINTASTEFPLRTNREMVQIVKMLNGKNLINVLPLNARTKLTYKYLFRENLNNFRIEKFKFVNTNRPPHQISLAKGSAYNIMQRNFLQNIFTDKKINDFIEWLKKTLSPDELLV